MNNNRQAFWPMLFVCVYVIALSCACATNKIHYRVGQPDNGFRPVNIKGADFAWWAKEDGSSLLVNSLCKAADDAPLNALTAHLLIGVTEQKVESETKIPWSGREAMETIVFGKLDGVLLKFKIFVMKKDGCVYDIVLAAPPDSFDRRVIAFQAVRDQFAVEAKP